MRSAGRSPQRVWTSQEGAHPRLADAVERHVRRSYERPVAPHTWAAWSELRDFLGDASLRPLVLDSGCGNGRSAHHLALSHPSAWIIAVDKSEHRLKMGAKRLRQVGRIVFVRAELGDLWRLMARARLRIAAHYLLYPNPWPKGRHLRRRWHGHPAFTALLALGGRLEARSNWLIYLEELSSAIRRVTGASAEPRVLSEQPGSISPFEHKYRRSGQTLYRLQVCLRPPDRWPTRPTDLDDRGGAFQRFAPNSAPAPSGPHFRALHGGHRAALGEVVDEVDLGNDSNQGF